MEATNSAGNNQQSEVSNTAPVFGSNLSSNSSASSSFGASSLFGSNLSADHNGKMNGDEKSSGKSFFLRPSPLQHHVNLIKEPTLTASPQINSFKLDPPKLICPLTEKKGFPLKGDVAEKEEASTACNGDSKEEHKGADDKAACHTDTATTTTAASTSAAAVSGGFVFGRNLAERVLNGKSQTEEAVEESKEESSMPTFETATTSGSTASAPSSLSLIESAAKQQSKDLKPEPKEGVKTQTGEEGESNVLQIMAKLHSFDKQNQSWLEKGRGCLRLNDMPGNDQTSFQSRLVMRAQGSLRVILNMKLWGGMLVERVGSKNLKVSAIDPCQGLMVYLITASMNDTEQMYEAVHSRSKQMEGKKRSHQPEQEAPVVNKKLRLEGTGDESNDSSAPYPETETSNEGASSPALHSSSSEA